MSVHGFNSVANAYRSIGLEGDIATASPYRLVQIIMERVLEQVTLARRAMMSNDPATKGSAIGTAISLLDELRASLDENKDPELANRLKTLYRYMSQRLLESNVLNDANGLDEVHKLMAQIKTSWDEIPNALEQQTDLRQQLEPYFHANS